MPMNRYLHQLKVRNYYRALVIVRMREAGMSLAAISEYFLICPQRVHQIVKRGPVPAQLELPTGK